MGLMVLSRNLYLSGQFSEARRVMEEFAPDAPSADQQPFVVVNLLALQSLLALEEDDSSADALARQAMNVAEAQGIRYDPLCGFAYLALARTSARAGRLAEGEQLLTEALTVVGSSSFATQHAQVLLNLAVVRHARGDGPGARDAMEHAHSTISSCADPGMLPALLEQTERLLGRSARKPPSSYAALTERELIVLRMLGTALTQQEIARELYVSVNTVRSQIQGIYRKTGAVSRQEAVARGHELGLIAGSSGQIPSTDQA
jgi:DNA-binding CsgD family transcriptional regulator